MALRAAMTQASSPVAEAVPIMAYPMPLMMARISEKSRLISPGVVMMSLIPCTAWRRTSSAAWNASKKLVPLGTRSRSWSF